MSFTNVIDVMMDKNDFEIRFINNHWMIKSVQSLDSEKIDED